MKKTPSEIIDALDGTSAVAEACEVTTGAVSQWRKEGIPKARLQFLRLLRPEVFKALEADDKAKGKAA